MKNLFQNLNNFFKTNLGNQVLKYFYFYSLTWLVHLIIISIITYFHLILNHNIGTIADWIVDRGWILIIVTKMIIFSIAVQFMKLKSSKFSLVKGMLRNAVSWPHQETFITLLFLLLGLVSAGEAGLNDAYIFDLSRAFYTIVGTLIFFGIDLIYILILDVFHPLKSVNDKKFKLVLFPFLFYFFTRITFIYEQVISFKFYSYFFIILYLAYWRRRNWTLPLFIIVLFFIPSFLFLGIDPVWNESFSLFKLHRPLNSFSMLILFIFPALYLEYRKKKNPEYIYRD